MKDHFLANIKVLEEAREKLLTKCPQCTNQIEDVFLELESALSIQSILDDDYKIYLKQRREETIRRLRDYQKKNTGLEHFMDDMEWECDCSWNDEKEEEE